MSDIGNRMKMNYEKPTRYYLPKKSYFIVRVDGKAFKSYTKKLDKPFDEKFIRDMQKTALYMCKNIQGCKFAYTQSDEISIMFTDLGDIKSELWFDGNVQKIASVSASLATSAFNFLRLNEELAHFDARVFSIANPYEVINYFIWRQQDCIRNSISSLAKSMYSQKELNGKNGKEMIEMCKKKGVKWDGLDKDKKYGTFITRPGGNGEWKPIEIPVFTEDKIFLKKFVKGLDKEI